MSARKPSFAHINKPKLLDLCIELGLDCEIKSPDQIRVYAATHVIDFWPARMKYHRVQGENILANEPYRNDLDEEFNEAQVKQLLATGELKSNARGIELKKPSKAEYKLTLIVTDSEGSEFGTYEGSLADLRTGSIDSSMMKLGNQIKASYGQK